MMIDREKLILMMDGDESMADTFINAFINQLGIQIPLIRSYSVNADLEMLSNSLHVMKSQASYMGLEEISNACENLEQQLSHGTELHQLNEQIEHVLLKLGEILNHQQ